MFFFPHHLPTTENLDGWWNTGPMWYIQRYTVGSQTLSEAGTSCQICCTGINKTCHFGFFKTNFGPDNIFLKLLLLLDYFCFAPFHKLCSYIIFQKMTCQHKNIFNRTVRVGILRKWRVEPAPSNRSRHSGYTLLCWLPMSALKVTRIQHFKFYKWGEGKHFHSLPWSFHFRSEIQCAAHTKSDWSMKKDGLKNKIQTWLPFPLWSEPANAPLKVDVIVELSVLFSKSR